MRDDGERERSLKRSAWLLGLFAAAFYVGFILWMALHGVGGGR